MRSILIVIATIGVFASGANAQKLTARTNAIKLDMSRSMESSSSSLPTISWVHPAEDYSSSEENKVNLHAYIESKQVIKSLDLVVGEEKSGKVIMKKSIPVDPEMDHLEVNQMVWLPNGANFVKLVVTNEKGATVHETRSVLVGENSFENVLAMDRKDFALFFATDRYEEWDDLVNPIDDAHSIAKVLEEQYGFQVEIVENASKDQVWDKIRSYADKKYNPQDQLLIFFAGHGQYDETFGEGYVVPTDAKRVDNAKSSYISHNRLRNNIDNIDCKHIMLAMDVCFGGTFDPILARSRALKDYSVSTDEMLIRKLSLRTRKYITSGGKEYVSDGIPGHHSPFAAKIIQALGTRGGDDMILTLSELKSGMENLALVPRFGSFGSDESTSDFVFIAR